MWAKYARLESQDRHPHLKLDDSNTNNVLEGFNSVFKTQHSTQRPLMDVVDSLYEEAVLAAHKCTAADNAAHDRIHGLSPPAKSRRQRTTSAKTRAKVLTGLVGKPSQSRAKHKLPVAQEMELLHLMNSQDASDSNSFEGENSDAEHEDSTRDIDVPAPAISPSDEFNEMVRATQPKTLHSHTYAEVQSRILGNGTAQPVSTPNDKQGTANLIKSDNYQERKALTRIRREKRQPQ